MGAWTYPPGIHTTEHSSTDAHACCVASKTGKPDTGQACFNATPGLLDAKAGICIGHPMIPANLRSEGVVIFSLPYIEATVGCRAAQPLQCRPHILCILHGHSVSVILHLQRSHNEWPSRHWTWRFVLTWKPLPALSAVTGKVGSSFGPLLRDDALHPAHPVRLGMQCLREQAVGATHCCLRSSSWPSGLILTMACSNSVQPQACHNVHVGQHHCCADHSISSAWQLVLWMCGA